VGIRYEWVQTGEGEMYEHRGDESVSQNMVGKENRSLTPDQKRLLEILDAVPGARELMEDYIALDNEDERLIIRAELKKALREQRKRKND